MDETNIDQIATVESNSINGLTNHVNLYNHNNTNNQIDNTTLVHTPYGGDIDVEKIIENKIESDNIQGEGVKDPNEKEKENKI